MPVGPRGETRAMGDESTNLGGPFRGIAESVDEATSAAVSLIGQASAMLDEFRASDLWQALIIRKNKGEA